MTDKEVELLVQYESKIRSGFPAGEVKTELLSKGFTEDEANTFIVELNKLSSEKSVDRHVDFRMIISAIIIIFGIFLMCTTESGIGIWFIISGAIKIGYDFFIKVKKDF